MDDREGSLRLSLFYSQNSTQTDEDQDEESALGHSRRLHKIKIEALLASLLGGGDQT